MVRAANERVDTPSAIYCPASSMAAPAPVSRCSSRRPFPAARLTRPCSSSRFASAPKAWSLWNVATASACSDESGALGVHAIGLGLAEAEGLNSKHAIKQVHRLLSNQGIDVWELFESWVPFVLAERKDAVVALDWTDFDSDGQSTIALHLITEHGRATPLVWKTVNKSELKNNRNAFEDQVISRCLEVTPRELKVTLLVDRGFADQKLFDLLRRWGVSYVIRCRGAIQVTNEKGEKRRADKWLAPSGRAVRIGNARITRDQSPVGAVVCVRASKMKEAWCLVTSGSTARAMEIVRLFGRRFTIEESFRDIEIGSLESGAWGTLSERTEQPGKDGPCVIDAAGGFK